jgi:putative ABC transport system permease protein
MAWFSRIRNLFRSDDLSREIDREMEFHIAERTDDLVARGMRLGAARYEARRRFGNYGTQKERTRERDLFTFVYTIATDLRYTFRALRATPAFAVVAVLSLGLGIGANTAIFTLINAVLLRSLPVSHPEELVVVVRGEGGEEFTNPLWEAIRDRQDVFSGAAAYSTSTFNLANGGEARRVPSSWVSGDFFPMLGVQPVVGRLLSHTDDFRGCPAVAVISANFWQSEYAGAADVIGKTIQLEGKPFPIVGVVDPDFFGVAVGQQTSIYTPICAEPIVSGNAGALEQRSFWWINILARPKPGLTLEQVRSRIASLSGDVARSTLPSNWPATATEQYLKSTLGVEPGAAGLSDVRTQYRKALWVLMSVVGLVLLIACANVANLLLARAAAREREMAVRLALGAGRRRLIGQLLTESVVLSLLGAAAGTAFAMWGTRVLVRMMSTSNRAVWLDLSIDLRVLGFTIAVAMATGILFGLAPAWRARRVDPHTAMKSHGRGFAEGHSRFGVGKALVVSQVALSLVLVVGAALLLGSWRRMATTNPGFQSDGVLVVRTAFRRSDSVATRGGALHRQILETLRATPGVVAASASTITPVGSSSWNNAIEVAGFSAKSERDAVVWRNEVTSGYFTTMRSAIVAGRDFNDGDVPTSPKVAVVTEELARKFFGGAGAIGRQFRVQQGKSFGPPIRIVGIVQNSKYRSIREDAQPIAYLATSQSDDPSGSDKFEVRVRGDAALAIPTIRTLLSQIAPTATLEFVTLEDQLARSLRLPRTLATLSGFFGSLALLLAAIGLYGIMSYSVARRRNEIGVRIALGAGQGRVVRMVLGEVGRMVMAGVAIGTFLALAGAKLVAAFLYGVKPSDPTTLAVSALVLATVGVLAALAPAARAARLDPVDALRED